MFLLSEMIFLIAVFVTSLFFFRWFINSPKNFPPGPPCLPIIGSAPFVQSENFHLYLESIKEKYGPVIGFQFGKTSVVAVAGAKEVKEVLSREEFNGRPIFPFTKPGIMFSEGQNWSIQRRFTLSHLRDFGFGKKSVENVILEEAENFFESYFKDDGIIQVSGFFTVPVINVLWAMMAGKTYSTQDKKFRHLLDILQKRFRAGNVTGGLSNMFPILRKLFPNSKWFKEEIESEVLLDKFLQESIDEHKSTKTENPRDFIDVYLTELEKKGLHPSFNEDRLKSICGDLFAAGSESVGNSLGFCLLYWVLFPEWQEKLYQEVKHYIENDSRPFLDGKKSFPLLQAFLSEVTRCNTIATLAVPHKAIQDTSLNNYFIPKGTMLLISIWSVLQDKEHWKDPDIFRPERFLEDDGSYNATKANDEWIPAFGIGKRRCPGESLAKSIIFVFIIALIREFQFSLPEGEPLPSTLCLPGFTNAPRPFKVKVKKRVKC